VSVEVIDAASDPTSGLAATTLKKYSDDERYWAVQIIGSAIAPFNSQIVNSEIQRWIDKANAAKDKIDDPNRSIRLSLITELSRVLTPYAPDLVAANVARIDTANLHNDDSMDALQQVVTGLVPYESDTGIKYITDGFQDVKDWHTDRWSIIMLIALAKANPDFVRTIRPKLSSSPYIEWIDASLNPLDTSLLDKAFAALSANNKSTSARHYSF
jgi:hypothetical protein